MIGKADVVYADLPCSGLGILGKKRDIRYIHSGPLLLFLYSAQLRNEKSIRLMNSRQKLQHAVLFTVP